MFKASGYFDMFWFIKLILRGIKRYSSQFEKEKWNPNKMTLMDFFYFTTLRWFKIKTDQENGSTGEKIELFKVG